MLQIEEIFPALRELVRRNPTLFSLLVVLFLLLYPFYQRIIKINFEQYLLLVLIITSCVIIFLALVQLPQKTDKIIKQLITTGVFSPNEIENLLRRCAYTKPNITLVDIRKENLDNYYLYHIEEANNIDIIAFTGETFTRVVRTLKESKSSRYIRLKEKIIKGRCKIRIILLKPYSCSLDSQYSTNYLWSDRASRDDRNLDNWHNLIENDRKFWRDFKDEIKEEYRRNQSTGEITIKYHTLTPCYAYFRADDTIVFGLYYTYKSGRESPAFQITNESAPILYNYFNQDFDHLWNEIHGESDLLIQVNQDGMYP
jgi:hypothetical protein